MAQLTFTQIEQLWIRNGGTPGWAPLMAGIAMAESGGNTQAFNTNPATTDKSVGLWQINYYGNLYTGRSRSFGSPTKLRETSDAQARAAIALSNNGHLTGVWGTPWYKDATWQQWVNSGAPPTPEATLVQQWVRNVRGTVLTAAEGPAAGTTNSLTAQTVLAAQATGSTKNLPIPTQGEQYAYRGERTFSIVTPSVVPGISATPPTSPHFGNNPVGDLATSLRFATSFGGWALMTAAVFIIGLSLLALGLVMLLMILFGPVTSKVVGVLPVGRAARALSPASRARRITARTQLATARTRAATRDEATAQYRAAGGDEGIRRRGAENRQVRRERTFGPEDMTLSRPSTRATRRAS